MSTLRANNLTRQPGSGVPDLGGVAANRLLPTAWVNFNGTGVVAIRDAHNVASITDGGVGQYTVNFTTLMATANFAPVVGFSAGGVVDTSIYICKLSTFNTAGVGVITQLGNANTYLDSAFVTLVAFGGMTA